MKSILTTIAALMLSMGVWAQSTDTMYVHKKGNVVYEFPTQDVDSVIFYRTDGAVAPPKDTVHIYDTILDPNCPNEPITIHDTVEIEIHDTICPAVVPPALPGNITFKSNKIWKVGSQEWSDVVMSTACNKETYAGSTTVRTGNPPVTTKTFHADCRNNPGFGDLFSWPAVDTFADVLCPEPWRVPDSADYSALDIAMGGTGQTTLQSGYNDEAIYDKYVAWGVVTGGYSNPTGGLTQAEVQTLFWTSTEATVANARYLHIYPKTNATAIRINQSMPKDNGMQVRCVKDAGAPVATVVPAENAVINYMPASLTLTVGGSETLVGEVMPIGTVTNPNVNWTSTNPDVATVNENGLVTAVAAGNAIVILTSQDGGFTDFLPVVVVPSFADGVAKFLSSQVWEVETGGKKYTWSDVVTFSSCAKTTYNAGTPTVYTADCRTSYNGLGDFFSWKAVDSLKSKLCPEPWRVPDSADFAALYTAVGTTVADYTSQWGANDGLLVSRTNQGAYVQGRPQDGTSWWSLTSATASNSYAFNLTTVVTPAKSTGKTFGLQVRCVKDEPVTP